jgi:hypothetical protein
MTRTKNELRRVYLTLEKEAHWLGLFTNITKTKYMHLNTIKYANIRERKLCIGDPSDRRMLAKLVPTFADGGCRFISATDRHGHILSFLYRSRYYFFQVAPHQLYSGG